MLRRPAAACPRRWPRAPGPSRRPGRRAGRPSGRRRARSACGSARGDDVVPVEQYSPSVGVPAGGRGLERRLGEPVGRRVGVGVEGGLRVARVAGPPADGDLLGVHRVAHDEVVGRRVGRLAGEEADGEVEGAPPGVDRRRAAAVGRAERGEDQRGPGRGGEVGRRPASGRRSRARRPRRAGRVQGTSCGVGSISTGPPARATAASSSRVTSPTGAVRRERRRARARPSLCSATASWRVQVERRRRAHRSRPARAAAASPSRARSAAARRAGAAAPAGRAPPRACRAPACARAACRRCPSRSRSRLAARPCVRCVDQALHVAGMRPATTSASVRSSSTLRRLARTAIQTVCRCSAAPS